MDVRLALRSCAVLTIALLLTFGESGVSAERAHKKRGKRGTAENPDPRDGEGYVPDRFECPVLQRDAEEMLRKAEQLLENGEPQVALSCAEDAIVIDDSSPTAYGMYCEALMANGNFYDAIGACRKAVDLDSKSAHNHLRLASTYKVSKMFEEAQDELDIARLLDPESAEVEMIQVRLAMDLDDYEAAVTAARRYRDLARDEFIAHYSLAQLLQRSPRYNLESLMTYKEALQLAPEDLGPVEYASIFFATFYSEQYLCEWSEYYEHLAMLPRVLEEELQELKAMGSPSLRPVQSLLHVRADKMSEVIEGFSVMTERNAREWTEAKNLSYAIPPPAEGDGRLRVGFVSADMGDHPVGTQFQSIFGLMDRSQFVSIAYALRATDKSIERAKMEAESDKLVDLSQMDFEKINQQINHDKIHVLLDMNGMTKGGRPGIFGLRPKGEGGAPLQAGLIGWPGSLHSRNIQNSLLDRIVVPPDLGEGYFSENAIYMPFTYQVNDYKQSGRFEQPTAAEMVAMRAAEGLPTEGFVFADFNTHFKFEPMIWQAWMSILQRVPGSVLWLMAFEGNSRALLKREVLAAGIAPDRVVWAPYRKSTEHVRRTVLADLVLDTTIYGGHTTSSHNLWAGVPVLTLPAESMCSRVATAMLDSIGLPELVTATYREYEDRAVALALGR